MSATESVLSKKNIGFERADVFKTFIIIIFLFVLITPILQQLFKIVPIMELTENRNKIPFPRISKSELVNGQFFKQFDAYYNDNYGFREQLIKLDSLITYKLFNSPSNDDVIIGKEGWFYYTKELNDYRHISTLSQEQINIIVDRLKKYQMLLNKSGTDFLCVLVPVKSSIYPEFMPKNISVKPSKTNYDLLSEALKTNGKVNYLLLKDELIKNKNTRQLYFKTDTHWNCDGAYIASKKMLNYLSKRYDKQVNMPEIVSRKKSFKENGDMNILLGLNEKEEVINPLIKTEPEGAKLGTKIFWYRDSFGAYLLPMFKPYFNETGDWNVAAKEKHHLTDIPMTYYEGADLVILEIVERNIPNLLEYNLDIRREDHQNIKRTKNKPISLLQQHL